MGKQIDEAFEGWFKKRHTKTGLYEKALLNDDDALYVKHEMRKAWQAAQSVPEGFVEKTESNTHHYFKLKDWNEWSCIDGVKDAITSDYVINSIVEIKHLEVVEIQQSTKYGLLRFAKRHEAEVVFFDSLEEAQQAQEPANTDLTAEFQTWFKTQPFYEKLIYQYGDRLFDRDGEVYRAQPVDIAYRAYKRTPGNE